MNLMNMLCSGMAVAVLGLLGCGSPEIDPPITDEPVEDEPIGDDVEALVGAPVCYYPASCINTPNPTYFWSPVAGAANYRFVLFKYVNGTEQQIVGKNVFATNTTGPALNPGYLYRWKVKGEGPGGADPGPYCGIGNYFNYDPSCP